MSKISTIYDALLLRLGAIFTDKIRIPNAYDVSSNGDVFLRNSWGLRIASSNYYEMEYNTYVNDRQFVVVFTREIIKTDTQTAQIDNVTKLLLEDVNTLQKELMNPSQIGVHQSIEIIDLSSTTGINEVFTNNEKFLSIEVSFNIKVSEDI